MLKGKNLSNQKDFIAYIKNEIKKYDVAELYDKLKESD